MERELRYGHICVISGQTQTIKLFQNILRTKNILSFDVWWEVTSDWRMFTWDTQIILQNIPHTHCQIWYEDWECRCGVRQCDQCSAESENYLLPATFTISHTNFPSLCWSSMKYEIWTFACEIQCKTNLTSVLQLHSIPLPQHFYCSQGVHYT